MGDHNEFYTESNIKNIIIGPTAINLSLKTIDDKTGEPYHTCCGDERAATNECNTGNWSSPFDLAYSNIPSLKMGVDTTIHDDFNTCVGFEPKEFKNSTHSDHYPIVGRFFTHLPYINTPAGAVVARVPVAAPVPGWKKQYSLYLVPFDYGIYAKRQKIPYVKKYWTEWGGNKPHVTLISFQSEYNIHDMKTMASDLAKSSPSKTKRWRLGNRGKVESSDSGQRILSFTSITLDSSTKLPDIKRKYKSLKIKTNLHLTLGIIRGNGVTPHEKSIVKAIKESKDWKVVIVERDTNRTVKWLDTYDFYD